MTEPVKVDAILITEFLKASLQIQTLRLLLVEKGLLSHEEFDARLAQLENQFREGAMALIENETNRKLLQMLEGYKGTEQ
jgi:hypothetical protein